jgi:D-alanyl-D-alanine carboxypeptidase
MAAILATVVFCASVVEADAARRHRRGTAAPGGNAAAKSESMGESGRYAAFVVDGKTGKVLFSRNAEAQRYPASLTKMMTLYVLFEELERGRVKLDTPFEVSAFASNQAPSKLGLRPGDTIEVGDAIRALVTKSANDVAVVIAENCPARRMPSRRG